MIAEVGRKARTRKDLRTLVRELEEHILCADQDARSLARAVGASPATLARALVRLRKDLEARGAELLSVRRGRRWHYEIRGAGGRGWERFLALVGSVPSASGDVDDVVYSGL